MSDESKPEDTKPEVIELPEHHDVSEVKELVDKIADAAPSASIDPRDIDKTDVLAGIKKVDQTILRLNKYVRITARSTAQANVVINRLDY
jgi:hypothetical protein